MWNKDAKVTFLFRVEYWESSRQDRPRLRSLSDHGCATKCTLQAFEKVQRHTVQGRPRVTTLQQDRYFALIA